MEKNNDSNSSPPKDNEFTDSLLKSTTSLKHGQREKHYDTINRENPLMIEGNSKNLHDSCTISSPLKDGLGSIQYGSIKANDNEPLIIKSDNKTINCCTKLKALSIEPFFFAFVFAYFINRSCLTNMIMDKGCLYTFNFTKAVCVNLSGNEKEKDMVEILGNNYTLYTSLLQIFGAFQTMFIAPWSDKYGRKLPLTLAIVGMILSDIGNMLCAIYFDSPLYFIIIARIPTEFFGGFICALTIVFSHSSEVSSIEFRALKYAFVDIAMGLGMALGSLTAGLMYSLGYVYIFLAASVIHCLCLPYILLCVPETKGLESEYGWREKICNFFVLESFSKGFKAAVRKRENNGRVVLMMLFASMCVIVLTLESLNALGFVFIHHLYDWDQGKFNTVNTYFIASQYLFLGVCMTVLFRKFRISDSFMGLIGVVSMMGKYGLISFSKLSIYLFYVGNIVGSMYGLSMLLIRTIISKLVDTEELGRVFAFLATCEAILPMFGTILVTKIFNATMDTFPNVSYMMTVLLLIFPLLTYGWLYLRSRGNATTSTISS